MFEVLLLFKVVLKKCLIGKIFFLYVKYLLEMVFEIVFIEWLNLLVKFNNFKGCNFLFLKKLY